MAANFHRRHWVVQAQVDGVDADDSLYRENATNEFWLEPSASLDSRLAFTASFAEDDMDTSWGKWVFFAAGDTPFSPTTNPTPATERLEAVRLVGTTKIALRLYVEKGAAAAPDKMHIRLGIAGGSGDNGRAIAQPR